MAFCQKCGTEIVASASFCASCGSPVALAQAMENKSSTTSPLVESLQILQKKISKNNAYLGVLIGFAVFAFSLFLSWANVPAGRLASDGGASSGWGEMAFLAILPLACSLYPVIRQQSVALKSLLINIAIAFALLGYNNVINRSTWQRYSQNWGSDLGAGFWIGLIAIIAISACGIAWSLHTAGDEE